MYTGEQYDPNVGFYYLRARYYNPEIGRSTTVDPWKGSIYDPVSLHKYIYCNNDPVDFVDWSGEFPIGGFLELTVVQSILSKFSYLRSSEFYIRMQIVTAGANLMGITVKMLLPDEILSLEVTISGVTMSVDAWLTAVNIATAIGSLKLSFLLVGYAFQFSNVAAGVASFIIGAGGVVGISELPQFLDEHFSFSIFGE